MKTFNVINYDPNGKCLIQYNIIPYFKNSYDERKKLNKKYKSKNTDDRLKVPVTFEDFKKFVEEESKYRFWSACEYEIVISDWPTGTFEEKIDVHYQIMMNIDVISQIVMDECNKK